MYKGKGKGVANWLALRALESALISGLAQQR